VIPPSHQDDVDDAASALALAAVRYANGTGLLTTLKCEALRYAHVISGSRPACGHSACRQNWIDTGQTHCVASAASFADRARRLLDRLDARMEKQTFLPGADAVHCTSTVGIYNRASGDIERLIDVPTAARATICVMLRTLRRIVESHRCMVALRGAYLKPPAR
jgi:hypothetical protein